MIGIKYLTQLFNAVFLEGYFQAQWKVAQIILILTSGKPRNELISYRPISLLPIVSKVFEKLFLKRLLPMVENTQSSVWLEAEALHNITDASNRTKNK
jgi:hypothetical protein